MHCPHCQHFIPDTIGFGQGIGQCHKYEDYKAQGASDAQLARAYILLGNKLFSGGENCTDYNRRYCDKYEELK